MKLKDIPAHKLKVGLKLYQKDKGRGVITNFTTFIGLDVANIRWSYDLPSHNYYSTYFLHLNYSELFMVDSYKIQRLKCLKNK
jgi:hypothetical protein